MDSLESRKELSPAALEELKAKHGEVYATEIKPPRGEPLKVYFKRPSLTDYKDYLSGVPSSPAIGDMQKMGAALLFNCIVYPDWNEFCKFAADIPATDMLLGAQMIKLLDTDVSPVEGTDPEVQVLSAKHNRTVQAFRCGVSSGEEFFCAFKHLSKVEFQFYSDQIKMEQGGGDIFSEKLALLLRQVVQPAQAELERFLSLWPVAATKLADELFASCTPRAIADIKKV